MKILRTVLTVLVLTTVVLTGCSDGRQETDQAPRGATAHSAGEDSATLDHADTETGADLPQPGPSEPPWALPVAAQQPVYPVAYSGEVDLLIASGRAPIDVGALIANGRTVQVGPQSYCDLQFGDRVVVRVGESSRATVVTQLPGSSRPVMEIELLRGSVALTVADLGPGEIMRVRTPGAVYQVRGTEFSVTVGAAGEELVVQEGAVAVWPRGLDPAALRDQVAQLYAAAADAGAAWTGAQAQALNNALDQLDNAAVTVRAGEQAFLDAAEMAKGDRLAAQLAEKLRMLETAPVGNRSGLVAEFVTLTREARGTLASVAQPRDLPQDELAAKLAMIDELRLLPVPKDPSNLSLLDQADGAELVKFSLRTVPQDARIFIGGAFVGTSVYEGIFRRFESISVRVTKDGYRERRIQIDRARSEVMTVQLERLPPSISVSSFLKAIEAGDRATVQTYLREGGSPDVRNSLGVPAVVMAGGLMEALTGETQRIWPHQEILAALIAAGADVDAAFTIEGETFKPLHAAVLAGVAGMDARPLIDQLIAAGAGINDVIAVQGEELTPLAIAVRWALFTGETREGIIKSLVAAGADLDVAITFNDEILTLREVAGQLIRQGDLEDSELLRMLRQAGVPG